MTSREQRAMKISPQQPESVSRGKTMTERSSGSSGSVKREMSNESPLKVEHIQIALINMLYPRNCDSLKLKAHEVKSFKNYQTILETKMSYSMLVENSLKQFSTEMVLKLLPNTPNLQQLFFRELSFYRYIEPQLRRIMVQNMQSPVPCCFLACGKCDAPRHRNPSMPFHKGPPEPGCDVGSTPLLLLQNLLHDGFKTIDPSNEMDYQHCAASLRALATFHGVSAVLDRNDPKLKRGSYLNTAFPFLVPKRGMFKQMETLLEEGMKIIGQLGPYFDTQELLPGRDVAKVARFMHRNLHSLLKNILKPHSTQLNTLCHANCVDSRSFLFLKDEKHKILICKLVGLNQVQYCRPAVDIVLTIFCAGNNDVRTSKVDILLEVYREQFNKTLEICQKKHHAVLPYSAGLLSVDHLQESVLETKLLGVALRAMIVAKEISDAYTTDKNSSGKQLYQWLNDNKQLKIHMKEALKALLEATEPYAGDCWLSTMHRACPHYLETKQSNKD